MSKTISCTNPNCGTMISVPEGAGQVICPNCNTWHWPATEDSQESSSGSVVDDGYGLPPFETDNNSPVEQEFTPPILPIQEDYAPLEQDPMPFEEVSENVGFLETDTGERLELKMGKNILGRIDSDLIIADRTVSRRHCVVELNKNATEQINYSIYDIGHLEGNPSTNGVFVSGRSLRLQDHERIPIANGSSIYIGKVRLTLKIA